MRALVPVGARLRRRNNSWHGTRSRFEVPPGFPQTDDPDKRQSNGRPFRDPARTPRQANQGRPRAHPLQCLIRRERSNREPCAGHSPRSDSSARQSSMVRWAWAVPERDSRTLR
jgi:hypothetical protein